MKHLSIAALLLTLITCSINGQVDSVVVDTTEEDKNLRFSILGGPGYTPDYGFLVGGSVLFTFRMAPEDSTLNRSVIPIAFSLMSNKSIVLKSRSQLFFPGDRFRIFSEINFRILKDNYYGVGYENNDSISRGETTTEFREKGFELVPAFMFRLWSSDLFFGPVLDLTYRNIVDPSAGVQDDPDYIETGGDETGVKIFNSGLGAILSYDTRDLPANSYSGMYLEGLFSVYSKYFGSEYDYQIYQLQYRHFKSLPRISPRKTLAWMAQGRYAHGDVPFTDFSSVGSPFDLRGYYQGQYRDGMALYTLLEYRHMLNFGADTKAKRFFSRMGLTAWGGVGFIGPTPVEYDGVLPNWGAGFRFEVQPRMNFRIDVGFDPGEGALVYFNMTEAF
jgi:hypothetical protein